MCALFGWLDYKHIVPYKVLKKLTQLLANAAEERGTDAAGIHFEALGLYVYASTESIMKKALSKSVLNKFSYSKVDCIEGEIISIDSDGNISSEEFEPAQYRSHFATWYDYEDSYYSIHEELLLAYCGCYGVDSSDVELLLEYGYTCDEIEDMLADHDLLRETLQMVKCEDSDNLYEQIYGCAY